VAKGNETEQITALENAVKTSLPEVTGWFEHLHAHPELSFKEFETTEYLRATLANLPGIEIRQPCETGLIGVLRGAHEGPIIALRADIDALNLQELADVPYRSQNKDVMHACGHDMHTACLLGAAKILSGLQGQLHGTVYFMFQAAEEQHPGGALDIIKSGALDGVKYTFGQHLIPSIPTGVVAFKYDTILGASDRFELKIQGKGGHAAFPNLAVDPVVIAAEIIMALQTVVSRKTNQQYNPVISVTMVNTPPGADNVIPDSIRLTASVRNLDAEVREEAVRWMRQLTEGIAAAHGATAEFNYKYGYDPLINDEAPTEIAIAAAKEFLSPPQVVILKDPIPAGEDFGYYGQISEICFYAIGTGDPEKGTNVSPHSPRYKADLASMYYGIMMYVNIINKLLIES